MLAAVVERVLQRLHVRYGVVGTAITGSDNGTHGAEGCVEETTTGTTERATAESP
jgi:hypothetical protein